MRLRAVAGDGRAVEGIAFRASGKKLGEALVRLKGAPVHLAGTFSVEPLRGPGTGADPGRRRRGGGAVNIVSELFNEGVLTPQGPRHREEAGGRPGDPG